MAIALHVVVIGAFVGASVWGVGEPPEPVIPVTFFAPAAAPPPPRGDGGHTHNVTPAHHGPQAVSPTIALPTDPDPTAVNTEPEAPDYPGSDDTDTPGDPSGVDDGTGTSPVVGSGLVKQDAPLIIGGDVRAPVLVSRAEPEYPEAARRAHLDGVVILEAVITAGGEVNEIRILRSANPLLDAAAEKAVRQWRYRPATLNGRVVSVYLTVTVTFGLKS